MGCGTTLLPADFRSPEWRAIRCDIDAAAAPDGVPGIAAMAQFIDASVDAVWSSHTLEHLPPHAVVPALAEFLRVLRPGGVAYLVAADVQSLAEKIAAGDLDGELYRSPAGPITVVDVLWGHAESIASGRQGWVKRIGFSAASLQRRLAQAGFARVSVQRRPQAFELFASAVRPITGEQLLEQPHNDQAARRGPAAAATDSKNLPRSIDRDPLSAESYDRLASAQQERADVAAAERSYREALRLDANHLLARLQLSYLLQAQWRRPEGLEHYREAARLHPDPLVQSNWPMLLNFAPEASDDEVYAAHCHFDRRLIAPLAASLVRHGNVPHPERRLRIAYLSRDFWRHSVRYFLLPVMAHHDHLAFEICCYHLSDRADQVTGLYRQYADHWVDAHRLTDEALARRVRADAIDILVDLAGYTDRNRLLVVGRKPAPIQIAYLGYPATTGISTLDYRISDRWIDPEPPAAALASSEVPLRFAHGYFSYAPEPDSPPVRPLPLDRVGQVTFGSLNQAAKLNRPLIQSWADILHRLPGSRLLIQNAVMHQGVAHAEALAAFAEQGIHPARIDFRPFGLAPAYLQTYHEVDIALDSFPYNGGTTTCEALWMGVPVVSRCGGRHVARLGLSILNQVGLGDLVADSAAGYVETAVALANDVDRLRGLRATMRERLLGSPLLDHAGFTRELEAAYREVWRRWCAKQ